MKKALTLFTLAITCAMTMAQERQLDDGTLKMYILDAYDGHQEPIEHGEDGNEIIVPRKPTAREIAKKYDVSDERMARVLEEMIRERLPLLTNKKTGGYGSPMFVLGGLMGCLEVFQSTNTLALLKECAVSINRYVRYHAIKSYVAIAGTEAMPSLLKVLEAKHFQTEQGDFYKLLEESVADLTEKKRNDDAEKLLIFMLNMAQREEDGISALRLDSVLCASIKYYATSVQRAQLVQRFDNDESWAIGRRDHVKSELEKIPVNERTDLSKRFKLMEQPEEKGEN